MKAQLKAMALILFIVCTITVKAQKTDSVKYFRFMDLPAKQIDPLLERRMISGSGGTIGHFIYKKGAVVPMHKHENEQYSLIIVGSAKVTIADKVYILKAGDGIIIPPNVSHQFESLEEGTIDIDFFTPKRQDWINGTDTYYKK